MDIKTIAFILLIGRIISVILMTRVVLIQIRLLRENNPTSIQSTRFALLIFAVTLLIGNLIPVIVDLATVLADVPLRKDPAPLSVLYALSNMTTSLISAFFFTYLYREAKVGRVMITEEKKKP